MADKNLDEKWVKEPIVKHVKRGGVIVEEVVERPDDSEDAFMNEITQGVGDISGGLSGFGKREMQNVGNVSNIPDTGITGFSKFIDSQDNDDLNVTSVDNDTIIRDAILKARENTESIDVIRTEIKKVVSLYQDIPVNWRENIEIRSAVVSVVAANLNVADELVDSFV